MESFKEWINEGWGRNLAVAGALGAGLFGANKFMNKPAAPQPVQAQSVTSPAANQFVQPAAQQTAPAVAPQQAAAPQAQGEKGWNDQLGDFSAVTQPDGSILYNTNKGSFKRVKNAVGGFKYVKVQ